MQIKVGYNVAEMENEIYTGQDLEDIRSITVSESMYNLVSEGDKDAVKELYRRYMKVTRENFNYRLIKRMLEYYSVLCKRAGGEGADRYGIAKKYRQID